MPADDADLFGLTTREGLALPDFARLGDEDYLRAIRAGMAAQREALAALAAGTAPPDAGLLRAWEHSARLLERAVAAFHTLKDADTSPRRDAIDAQLSGELARHHDAIWLDRGLYDRFVALDARARSEQIALDEQDAWLTSEILRRYRRAGIELSEPDQACLRELNERLATLQAAFSTAVVAGRGLSAVALTDPAGLEGLSPEQIEAAAAAARRRGWDGWALELVNTTRQPLMAHLSNRDTRQLLYEASVGRGRVGEADTRPLLCEIARLRAQKAALLGFEHFAAYVADDGCAKTTPAVADLLTRVAGPARRNVEREAAALATRFADLVPGAAFQAWDWQWVAERDRTAALALDLANVPEYLPFESVLENGVFAAATALYGLAFTRRDDLGGYTPDCRAYEVREADGTLVGGVIFDPYARPTKGGGAWMTALVEQNHLFGELPAVTNNANLVRPAPGAPTLMTWDEVTTLFHEFGHDLHGLLSDVRYPGVSGTRTPTDFVEYPSQVNEIWAAEPSLMARYARHWRTGAPMPSAWIEALASSGEHGVGYDTFEKVAAMLLDQAWHTTPLAELPTDPAEVDAFEQAALERAGVWFPLVPPRYRSCYFTHIWGHGYAAGYYSYLWSEVLDADTAAWFAAHGGLDRGAGESFRRGVLAVGGSRDVMAAYREFRGADPDPAHLLLRYHLEETDLRA